MKKLFPLVFRYVAAFAVFFLLYLYLNEKGNLLSNASYFNFWFLTPVILLISLHLYFLITIWKIILVKLGKIEADSAQIFYSFFGGRTLGFLTPGQTGELLKGLFFQENSRKHITGLSVIFAGYGMLTRMVLGSLGALYFLLNYSVQYMTPSNQYFKWALIIILILIISIWRGWKTQWWNNLIPTTLIDFWNTLKSQLLSKSKNQVILLFIYSLMANIAACFSFLMLLNGFSVQGFTLEAFLAFEAAYFTMLMLPVTPAGLGVREGSRVYFFSLIGYDGQVVFLASIIMFLLNIGIPAIIGIPVLRFIHKSTPDIS